MDYIREYASWFLVRKNNSKKVQTDWRGRRIRTLGTGLGRYKGLSEPPHSATLPDHVIVLNERHLKRLSQPVTRGCSLNSEDSDADWWSHGLRFAAEPVTVLGLDSF